MSKKKAGPPTETPMPKSAAEPDADALARAKADAKKAEPKEE